MAWKECGKDGHYLTEDNGRVNDCHVLLTVAVKAYFVQTVLLQAELRCVCLQVCLQKRHGCSRLQSQAILLKLRAKSPEPESEVHFKEQGLQARKMRRTAMMRSMRIWMWMLQLTPLQLQPEKRGLEMGPSMQVTPAPLKGALQGGTSDQQPFLRSALGNCQSAFTHACKSAKLVADLIIQC